MNIVSIGSKEVTYLKSNGYLKRIQSELLTSSHEIVTNEQDFTLGYICAKRRIAIKRKQLLMRIYKDIRDSVFYTVLSVVPLGLCANIASGGVLF